jgi:arginine/ornithine N-succinyltransferase beta subunit
VTVVQWLSLVAELANAACICTLYFEANWAKSNRPVSMDRSMTLTVEKRRMMKKRGAAICFHSD